MNTKTVVVFLIVSLALTSCMPAGAQLADPVPQAPDSTISPISTKSNSITITKADSTPVPIQIKEYQYEAIPHPEARFQN